MSDGRVVVFPGAGERVDDGAASGLGLANGVACLVATNQFTPAAQGAPEQVTKLLLAEHERKSPAAR